MYFDHVNFKGTGMRQACEWDLRDRARAGRHKGKTICQHDWSCMQHKKFLLKITQAKVYYFLKTPRALILNCWRLSQEKEWSRKHFIFENKIYYVIIRGIIGKTNYYWHLRFFLRCYYKLVNIKNLGELNFIF